MPGIAAIVGTAIREKEHQARAMLQTMMHEPFYTSGVHVDDRLGAAVGWVCHPGSFSDCMPVWNETRDICLVFAGEHFAGQDERSRLRARGHEFDDENAVQLVHLYEEDRAHFFERLNGSFSGLILDLQEKKIALFNDRYGLGRLYWHKDGEWFYFASEAKALLGLFPELRRLDDRSVAEFLSCGSVLQNRTLFTGMSVVPGGSLWTFRAGRLLSCGRYFEKENWENQSALCEEDYYSELRNRFVETLPAYFRAKQPVAMSVTGGLDTRMIMAWARCEAGSLPCYTFGSMYRESSDVRLGRRVAQAAEQLHEVVTLNSEFFPQFPALAARSVYLTDGTVDVTGSAGLFVHRIARHIAPVRITGNFGDEVLRGHVVLKPNKFDRSFISRDLVPFLDRAAQTCLSERQGHPASFALFKQLPWSQYGRFALEQTQLMVRSPFSDNRLASLVYQAPPGCVTGSHLSERLVEEGNTRLATITTDRGLLGHGGKWRTALRRSYLKFTRGAEYLYDYGMPHWLCRLDRSLGRLHLERLLLGAHKYHHFRTWYRNELSSYVKEMLLDTRALSRPYLNSKTVQAMVEAHVTGQANYTLEIHKMLTCELIHSQLLDSDGYLYAIKR